MQLTTFSGSHSTDESEAFTEIESSHPENSGAVKDL